VLNKETVKKNGKLDKRATNDNKSPKIKSDDDNSFTGSAIIDGIVGIPSSPTALIWDIATHDGSLF